MNHLLFFILQVSGTLSALAGAIPVVGGIASAIINGINASSTNASNQAFQENQLFQQENYNTNMYNEQTLYNSPQEAMSRFEAAGLNPNLIYGAGSSAATFAGTPPRAPSVDYVAQQPVPVNFAQVGADAVNAYNNTRVASAQTDNLSAQTANAAADTALKNAETINTTMESQNIPKTGANIDASTGLLTGKSSLIQSEGDAIRAGIANTMANTVATSDANERQQVMLAPNLLTAYTNVLNTRMDTLLKAAQTDEVKQQVLNLQTDLESTNLKNLVQQMDINMRNNGIMPGSSQWTAAALRMLGTPSGLNSMRFTTGSPLYSPDSPGGTNYVPPTSNPAINNLPHLNWGFNQLFH